MPAKYVETGFPAAKKDTGLYIEVDSRDYGPVLHPKHVKEFNDFFWRSLDLKDFKGGVVNLSRLRRGLAPLCEYAERWHPFELSTNTNSYRIKVKRKTGGGWIFLDAVVLTSRMDFDPRKERVTGQ